MYIALWRNLPGDTWVKVLCCVGIAVLVLVVLFYGIFPAIESWQMRGGQIVG